MTNIPSPFGKLFDKEHLMLDELEVIFKKYGFSQFAWLGGKNVGTEDSRWTGASNVMSEGMANYMVMSAEYMREALQEEEEDK